MALVNVMSVLIEGILMHIHSCFSRSRSLYYVVVVLYTMQYSSFTLLIHCIRFIVHKHTTFSVKIFVLNEVCNRPFNDTTIPYNIAGNFGEVDDPILLCIKFALS